MFYVLDTRHLPVKQSGAFVLKGWVVSGHRSYRAAKETMITRAEGAPEGAFIVFETATRYKPGMIAQIHPVSGLATAFGLGLYLSNQIREICPPEEADKIFEWEAKYRKPRHAQRTFAPHRPILKGIVPLHVSDCPVRRKV